MARPIKHRDKWRIRWVDQHGRRQSEVHEEYKAAQTALSRHETAVDEIRRGVRQEEPPAKTFDDLCELWETKRVPLKKSGDNDLSVIRQLKKHFSGMMLKNIGVDDADEYVDARDDIEPKTIANHLTLLISMMNYAAELNVPWIAKVPPFRKPKIIVSGRDYRYLHNDAEIARVLNAAAAEGEMVCMLYRMAIFTGMRAGELAGLQWDDINLTQRFIMVQRSFTGSTKSGAARAVPILDALLAPLEKWKKVQTGTLVFTNRDGKMLAPSGRIFQDVLHRVLESAGFSESQTARGKTRRHLTFHGFRHTFASHWMMRGGNLFKLQKILGHSSITMTERYSHLTQNLFAEDYGRLGAAS